MDRQLREDQRRKDQDPEDRRGAEALARARLRAQDPKAAALLSLTRRVLGFLAARDPGTANAAALADQIIAPRTFSEVREAERASLERLRPLLGEARGAPERPGQLMPLDFLDPAAPVLGPLRAFLSYAADFNDITPAKAWAYRILALPKARGLKDARAVTLLALDHPSSLSKPYRRGLEPLREPGPEQLGGLPAFRGFPAGLAAIFEAHLIAALGADWVYIDTGIDLGSTFSDIGLLRFGEDWYALEQVFD